MSNSSTSKKCGFTLIEVMISVFIFSLLILMFAACIPQAKKAAAANGQYAQAINLCQHKIDAMRAVGFGQLNYASLVSSGIIDASPASSPYAFAGVDSVANFLSSPTTSITISTVAGNTDIMKVVVTITWKPAPYESRTDTVTLSAYITNVG